MGNGGEPGHQRLAAFALELLEVLDGVQERLLEDIPGLHVKTQLSPEPKADQREQTFAALGEKRLERLARPLPGSPQQERARFTIHGNGEKQGDSTSQSAAPYGAASGDRDLEDQLR